MAVKRICQLYLAVLTKAEGQFKTTVIRAESLLGAAERMRKRWPSDVTSYRLLMRT